MVDAIFLADAIADFAVQPEGLVSQVKHLLGLKIPATESFVGRLGDSEHFRNVLRYDVKTSPEVLALRLDASLYFANAKYLENFLTKLLVDRSEVKSVLLVCSAINLIDASALEILEGLIAEKSLKISFLIENNYSLGFQR